MKNEVSVSDLIKIEMDGNEMSYIVTEVTFGKYIDFIAKSIIPSDKFPKEIHVKQFKNAAPIDVR